MEIVLNKAIKDEHGNLIKKFEINENITCGDLISIGDCISENEMKVKLAATKCELSYSDLKKLSINDGMQVIVAMNTLLGGNPKSLPEKQS